ncbi:MAG: acyl-CoA dehydrogenase [Luteitalea sp.]|nr:acyl-CoA dehydrogenase [Luteitalea sp.]
MTTIAQVRRGGWWLLEDTVPDDVFTPERLSDEHRMIGRTALEFVTNEVLPNLDGLEQKDWELARQLVRRCGELGLLATDVPEMYGGLALDKVSSVVVTEAMARSASFGATFGAMTGLSIMPILCFGTDAQKQRYLPRLVSGEIVGAYALSESSSGSDALGARARAARQADGSFLLNGEKMWITNGGFADLYVVFAKVDGDHFSAFLVERGASGVSSGAEEHKMGLHGSSTAALILQDVRVPASSLLGEVGRGHKVAFNVLNYGRFKLGASCCGGAKSVVGEAARYAATRKQFGKSIASFGAIKHKIAEMTARLYAFESLLYRTAGLIDLAAVAASDHASGTLTALEEFAVEASIVKVAGSEMLDFLVDENVQIHGGNGYVHDYPAERHYRDARINRIFEGTNEINRLLIPGMLMRRAVKGDLPLIPAAKRLQDELLTAPFDLSGEGPLEGERRLVTGFKKIVILTLGAAMQTWGERITEEQEVLCFIADMAIDALAAESAVLRAGGAQRDGTQAGDLHSVAAQLYVQDAASRIERAAREAIGATLEGDLQKTALAAVRRFAKTSPANTVALRRLLADRTVAKEGYLFQ